MTDPIADFLTQIRNAVKVKKQTCTVPHSKMKAGIAGILKECGYIRGFAESEAVAPRKNLTIELKFVDGESAITELHRVSRPGRRLYFGADEIPKVLGGMGAGILTTSHGLMTDREARRQHLGGEMVARVW
jgi:small subunit ribosomal protein S8